MSRVKDVAKEYPQEKVLTTSSKTTVYTSRDPRTGGAVAVKLISASGSPEVQAQRFLRVLGAVRSMKPAGLPRVVDFGLTEDGDAFLVMELIAGGSLTEGAGDSPGQRVERLAGVVDALEELARGGVFHHNLNPENIVVVSGADGERVQILGFGTAAFLERNGGGRDPAADSDRERFVAPEQLAAPGASAAEDWRSDLFSLAVIASDVLGADTKGVAGNEPSVSLPENVRSILLDPNRLENALAMALRRDPRQRKVGWADLHHALRMEAPESPVPQELDATVRIPLDQLPLPDSGVSKSAADGDTDSYEIKEPPKALDDQFTTDAGKSLDVPAPGVLGNDFDAGGQPLRAVLDSGPRHGLLALLADGSFSYAPDSGFDGSDSFTYKANNGFSDSDPATVTITVNAVKKPPVAVDDVYVTDGGKPLAVPAPGVLGNDSDADGQPLMAIVVKPPSSGTLVLEPDGAFCYTPAEGFDGVDGFSYKANNGLLSSGVATVKITVRRVETAEAADVSATRAMVVPPEMRKPSPPDDDQQKVRDRAAAPAQPPVVKKPKPKLAPPPIPRKKAEATSPPPPPSPPPVRQPVAEEMPPPTPGPRLPIDFLRQLSPMHWAAIAGGVVILLVIVVLIALSPDRPEEIEDLPPPTVAPPTRVPTRLPTPTPIPLPTIDPRLTAAENALIAGDADAARVELEALTQDDIVNFSQEEAGLYDHLVATAEGGDRDEAINDLRGGLSYSSMKMIRRAMSGLAGMGDDEIAAVPGLARDLGRGHEAIQLQNLMIRARDNGDHAQVLERATALLAILPDYSTARGLREEAAVALENDAEALATGREFVRAIATLEPISRFWPARDGLSDRLDRYRELQEEDLRLQAEAGDYQKLIDEALERGESGVPDEGLRMLERRKAPASLEASRREAINSLEARLAALDVSPPQIEIVGGAELTYKKNESAQLELQVSDDYRVVSVVAMLRSEGATAYGEIQLTSSNEGRYRLEISPQIHHNDAVEFYIEAIDISGHVGRLGTQAEPLVVARKGLFKRILRK